MAGVVVACAVVKPGIHFETFANLALAAFLLGMLNAFVRPILMLLSLPLMIYTLGLFTLVINGLLLFAVGWMLKPGFTVASFKDAFWGALLITFTSLFLNILTGSGSTQMKIQRGNGGGPRGGSGGGGDTGGNGPVIDV
jgi:putative membrane protein